jgi:1-acyl-sn-glycerol-3-phosphate acyltransferase
MLIGSLVPVDRRNRDAGITAVRDAVKAIEQGLNMTIYVEGKRSFDGKLLPFKKGPFYLAEECSVPVVPITISGTEECHAEGALCHSSGNGDGAISRSH